MVKTTKHHSNELHAPISGVIPAAVIAAGLSGPVAWSAPGDLDPTFGNLGLAELPQDLSGAIWALEAIDDKYLVAGNDEYSCYYYCYYEDGTEFAASLSGTGVADPAYRPAFPVKPDRPNLAWQSDGRLVGSGPGTSNAYVIFRLATDGSLDPTFGTGGTITFDRAIIDKVQGVTVDPDGRIVISGTQANTSVLLRLMPDGTWDPSFGTNGVARAPASGRAYWTGGIVRTPAGAYRVLGGDQPGCVVRGVTASGNVDDGFGSAGSAGLASSIGAEFSCSDLDVLADGRLIVSGRDDTGAALVRLSASGSFDATFSSDAAAYLGSISATAVSASGSVLVAGFDREFLPGIVVARLLQDGRVDTGFGADGKAWVDLQSGIESYTAATVLAAPTDDQILVAGGQGPYWDSKPFMARLSLAGTGPGVIGIKTTDVQTGESERQATIVVRRTGGSSGAVSVGYRTETAPYGDLATEGQDYAVTQGRLEWASGETADKTIVVPILGDQVDYEGSEQFRVKLEEPQGGRLGRSAGTVTILGDGYPHGAFRIIAGTPVVGELDSTATFFVSRVDGRSGAVSVTVEPVAGTAEAGADYVAASTTLTWADGDLSQKIVSVSITRDQTSEPEESFSMKLSNPTGGAIIVPDATSATVAIQDSWPQGGHKSGGGIVGLANVLLLGLGALLRRRIRVPMARFR